MDAPPSGYVAFEESGTVTFILRDENKTRAAVLVTKGDSVDFPGEWAVAEFRTCDSAEFSAASDFGAGVDAWSHPEHGLIHERPGAASVGL